MIKWLAATDYTSQQFDLIKRKQAGTGDSVFNSPEYQAWLQVDGQTLFCHGAPGVGKSILTSMVVEDLARHFKNDKSVGVAYIYCNSHGKKEQEAHELLKSILLQLVQQLTVLPDFVQSLYAKCKNERLREPTVEEISDSLLSTAADYSRIFILINGIDECQASSVQWTTLLTKVFALRDSKNANVFITSRTIPKITEKFAKSTTIEIRASSQDVAKYLDGRMECLPQFVKDHPGLQDEIKSVIVEASDGT